ncbi:MAG: cyclic 2,3-diphosphoglycerate synthase [Armatimonadota bacterium]|nr:cyclic 2,3-diphosphoglycerate synthase [Armatimonadota bacterium]MDR7451989.1 cyclic 2,3-diphosphoglycerate synthase [Armatimonadota bacterium]MDR7467880.1 cyclic 2,3-diphosphoglycerate synthase [Armatimonadota bacterium]MDR7494267.1 cyclic 2,3-diphosphoglycerate synthase [Armatimonadota bacterium]MDR7500048.1 cyclic 2,3-diphosphoglycerate synthase [Armatimonadota bacterium]
MGQPRSSAVRRVLILGAGGRDFHNFNVFFRTRPEYEVVGFTATQIPALEGRVYPPALAGERYPQGIPIYPEEDLERLIREHRVDDVVFAYSDVSHEHVMHLASRAAACGASFLLLGPRDTMLASRVPVVSIGAARTGAGKSQTTRRVAAVLKRFGRRVAVIRHPMAYGDFVRQRAQRFATLEDLDRYDATIEEREEYEPHLLQGTIVYAGVDYAEVLARAEAEAEVIVWDGGNNDFPFLRPSLHIVVLDPHRAGHELRYHPGETNLRMADVLVINKVDTARPDDVMVVRANAARVNPRAVIVEAASPVSVDDPALIRGRRVLVVEDGPTLTHGGMAFGAATLAARNHGARELVDPRPHAVGSIREVFEEYRHLGPVLPAMGYGPEQVRELRETIERAGAEVVVIGTPVDLRRLMTLAAPAVRVRYELEERTRPDLEDILREWQEGR